MHHRRTFSSRTGLLALLAASLLSACTSTSSLNTSLGTLITPYKIEVVQGNVVTREQAQALQPGMARAQVIDVLGTPLLTSVFHANRWDYVFSLQREGQAVQQRRFTVFFNGDSVDRFEGDELPSETEFVASIDTRRKTGQVPQLQATPAQLQAFDKNNPKPATTSPLPPPATTSYPPLEPSGATR